MSRSVEPYLEPGYRGDPGDVRTSGHETRLPTRFKRWLEVMRTRIGQIPAFTYTTGSPEGVIVGEKGDLYFDTTANVYYVKTSDGGKTGWQILPLLAAAGVDNQVAVFTGAGEIEGNSNFTWDGVFLQLTSAAPTIELVESDAGTDQGKHRIQANLEALVGQLVDDAEANAYNWLTVTRSGTGASIQADIVTLNAEDQIELQAVNEVHVVGGDLWLEATQRLYLDEGIHTYITEGADDRLDVVVGGVTVLQVEDDRVLVERQAFAPETALSDGVNISWNLDQAQAATVTLAGNRTLDNPTNQEAGSSYTLIIKQDATGSRTLAYGTAYKFPGGTAPTLTTTASAVDVLACVSDGTSMYCNLLNDFQ